MGWTDCNVTYVIQTVLIVGGAVMISGIIGVCVAYGDCLHHIRAHWEKPKEHNDAF